MKRETFISKINELKNNRPKRIVTYVSGIGPFTRRRQVTRELPDWVLDLYQSFIDKFFLGFEAEYKPDSSDSYILYSLSSPPKTIKEENILFQTEIRENKAPNEDDSRILYQTEYNDSFGKDFKKITEETKRRETFSDMLIRLQNRKHIKAPDLYRKAGIDSKHYSKIISDRNYKTKKETVFALAIALELNLNETVEFLESAGYAFNPSNLFDMTIKYFIQFGNYDRINIDMLMDSMDLPLLPQNW